MTTANNLARLTVYIEENLRAGRHRGIHFVDPRKLRERVMTSQNHVIFGRRGAGKTTLLSALEETTHCVTVYVNLEDSKDCDSRDTIRAVLLTLLEELRLRLKQQRPFWDLRAGRLRGGLCKLEKQLRRASREDLPERFVRLSVNLKELFERLSRAFEDKPIYLALDDFYFVPQSQQAEVLDYFHRLTKDSPLYLKVGTVRARSALFSGGGETCRGIELGHDAHEIDIDYTLEKFAEMESFLEELLESANRESGANLQVKRCFRDDGFRELCRASEGVPRNFLSLFVRLANRHRDNADAGAFIGAEEISAETGLELEPAPAAWPKTLAARPGFGARLARFFRHLMQRLRALFSGRE